MADEITISSQLKSDKTTTVQGTTSSFSVTMANALTHKHHTDQAVGTSAEALSLGDVVTTDEYIVSLVNQDATNFIELLLDAATESSTATAGGASTLTDGIKAWATNQWKGFTVSITGGTGSGQKRIVASNTGTVLTVSAAWVTQPDATSTYTIDCVIAKVRKGEPAGPIRAPANGLYKLKANTAACNTEVVATEAGDPAA